MPSIARGETTGREAANITYGRLLESAHYTGHGVERMCGELEALLDADRWQAVGSGFARIDDFLATISLAEFEIAVDRRKQLARRLRELRATDTATAKTLGVSRETIARDLGKRTNVRTAPDHTSDLAENEAGDPDGRTDVRPHWTEIAVDPSREAKRIAREAEREIARTHLCAERPTPAPPTGRYRLIVADPPWRFEHPLPEGRAIENHYPTMSLDEICALPVPAADDCVLYLWAPASKLAEGQRVLEAWGFTHRTGMVWVKDKIGMGYWARQQHEDVLIATKGTPQTPATSRRPASVFHAPRGAHSAKPKLFFELIERAYPHFTNLDRVELFAREPRDGWSAWGNDPALLVRSDTP